MPTRSTILCLLLALSLVIGSGCAEDSTRSAPGGQVRVETIDMLEMRYTPARVEVRVGEVVTFRFVNKGRVRHEAVIGDQAAQDAAVAIMRQMDAASSTIPTTTPPVPSTGVAGPPGRSLIAPPGVRGLGGHDARLRHPGMGLPNVVSVEPGQTGELTFSFAKPGTLIIGCHEPGHYEAGMRGEIVVTP